MNNSHRYRTILLFGAPGSGKGTQGKILGQVPGFFHLSCGEVFRGLNPTKTIADALRTYLTTAQLPPLPKTDIADG
jgi:adenylate kinase